MSEELATPLQNFKAQLDELRPVFEEKMAEIDVKSKKFIETDNRIAELVKAEGNQKITIQVGGKVYVTLLKTLLSKKDNIFYKWIYDDLEVGLEYPKSFFFDRDNTYFSSVLDYLRTGVLSIQEMPLNIMTELREDLAYYGIWPAHRQIDDLIKNIVIISFTSSSRYSSMGTHSIDGIGDKNNKGGICVQSPYEICFELNLIHNIKGFEIRGFNDSGWTSSYGEGASVSVGIDKTNFKLTSATIPSGFGTTIKTVTFKEEFVGKFVKIKNASNYLGIGYIKFFK